MSTHRRYPLDTRHGTRTRTMYALFVLTSAANSTPMTPSGTAVAGVVMVPCAVFLHFSMPDTESVYAHEQSVTILASEPPKKKERERKKYTNIHSVCVPWWNSACHCGPGRFSASSNYADVRSTMTSSLAGYNRWNHPGAGGTDVVQGV